MNDGPSIRLSSCRQKHDWGYDYFADRLANDKKIGVLTVIDEHSREGPAVRVENRFKCNSVLDLLNGPITEHQSGLQYEIKIL